MKQARIRLIKSILTEKFLSKFWEPIARNVALGKSGRLARILQTDSQSLYRRCICIYVTTELLDDTEVNICLFTDW